MLAAIKGGFKGIIYSKCLAYWCYFFLLLINSPNKQDSSSNAGEILTLTWPKWQAYQVAWEPVNLVQEKQPEREDNLPHAMSRFPFDIGSLSPLFILFPYSVFSEPLQFIHSFNFGSMSL